MKDHLQKAAVPASVLSHSLATPSLVAHIMYQKFAMGIPLNRMEKDFYRPKKDNKVDKKQEYIDNNDRIEVERAFSLAKRRYGLGLITAKRKPLNGGFVCSNFSFIIFKVQTSALHCKIYAKQLL